MSTQMDEFGHFSTLQEVAKDTDPFCVGCDRDDCSCTQPPAVEFGASVNEIVEVNAAVERVRLLSRFVVKKSKLVGFELPEEFVKIKKMTNKAVAESLKYCGITNGQLAAWSDDVHATALEMRLKQARQAKTHQTAFDEAS